MEKTNTIKSDDHILTVASSILEKHKHAFEVLAKWKK